jgi:hypothetical protein
MHPIFDAAIAVADRLIHFLMALPCCQRILSTPLLPPKPPTHPFDATVAA